MFQIQSNSNSLAYSSAASIEPEKTKPTVWVTGASSGIGRETAERLAKLGAKVVLFGRDRNRLEKAASEITKICNARVFCVNVDVSKHRDVTNALKKLPAAFASPDILVNNAGVARGLKSADETSHSESDEMIDTNIKGVINFTKAALPAMKEKNSGHIFMIGSVAGIKPYANGAVYCGSKSFVEAYSLALREELVKTRIRLTLISPGMVGQTHFSNVRLGSDEAAANVYKDITPLNPKDIADQIVFAASRPAHVNIAHIEAYPVHQASTTTLHRGDVI